MNRINILFYLYLPKSKNRGNLIDFPKSGHQFSKTIFDKILIDSLQSYLLSLDVFFDDPLL